MDAEQPAGPVEHPPHHPDDLRHFARDDVIFNAGDPAHTMFVVVSGQAEVRIEGRVADVIHPGGILGELGVIDGTPRAATAVAVAPTAMLEIDEKEFLELVRTQPFFALKVMRLLVARLKRTQTMRDLKV